MVVDKPQLSASHHSLLTKTSWSGCHRLSLRDVPPLLSSILGTPSWRLPLKPLAAGPSGGSRHLNLVWLQTGQILPPLYNYPNFTSIEVFVLLFADDLVVFLTDPELLINGAVPFVSHPCPFITSSLQGPPSYSTHAGLHSNQILTVKVCPSSRLHLLLLPLLETLWSTDLGAANISSFPLFCSLFVESLGYWFYSSPLMSVLYYFSSSLFSAVVLLLF